MSAPIMSGRATDGGHGRVKKGHGGLAEHDGLAAGGVLEPCDAAPHVQLQAAVSMPVSGRHASNNDVSQWVM
jgi:hypothetical protein